MQIHNVAKNMINNIIINFNHLSRRKKSGIIGVFIILVIAIVSYAIYHFSQSKELDLQSAKIVETQIAKRTNIVATTRFIGTIRATQATLLMTRSKGILDIVVASGAHVKKGDVLATIREPHVVDYSKLSTDSASIAKIQFERVNQLAQKGLISKNEADEKKNIWIEAQKKLADAKAQLSQITIVAPFDGIVGLFKLKDGAQVQEGEVLAAFYDPSSLTVEFDVPIAVVKMIKDKTQVRVNGHEYPLTYIQRFVDDDTHMCPATVNIQCSDCIIGTTVDVDVVLEDHQQSIVIPIESVFLREGENYVYLVKNHRAILTKVTLGIQEKDMQEISNGIAPGDAVVVRGQSRLYPNALVTTEGDSKQKSSKKKLRRK